MYFRGYDAWDKYWKKGIILGGLFGIILTLANFNILYLPLWILIGAFIGYLIEKLKTFNLKRLYWRNLADWEKGAVVGLFFSGLMNIANYLSLPVPSMAFASYQLSIPVGVTSFIVDMIYAMLSGAIFLGSIVWIIKNRDNLVSTKGAIAIISLLVLIFLIPFNPLSPFSGVSLPNYHFTVGEQGQSCDEYCSSISEDCLAEAGFAYWGTPTGTTVSWTDSLMGCCGQDVWPRPSDCDKKIYPPTAASHNRPACVCGDKNEQACFKALGNTKYYKLETGFGVYDKRARRTEWEEVDMSFCLGTTTTTTTIQPSQCSDSDNGNNIYTKGTCRDNYGSYADTCNGNSIITEYFCSGGRCNSDVVFCPAGYTCSGGACVSGGLTTTTTTIPSTTTTTTPVDCNALCLGKGYTWGVSCSINNLAPGTKEFISDNNCCCGNFVTTTIPTTTSLPSTTTTLRPDTCNQQCRSMSYEWGVCSYQPQGIKSIGSGFCPEGNCWCGYFVSTTTTSSTTTTIPPTPPQPVTPYFLLGGFIVLLLGVIYYFKIRK